MKAHKFIKAGQYDIFCEKCGLIILCGVIPVQHETMVENRKLATKGCIV